MADVILFILGIICLLLSLGYKYLTWNFQVWEQIGLPGPKPSPYFGNFRKSVTGKQLMLYDLDELYSQYKRKYRAIGVFVTRDPQILLLDPALVHEVMVRSFGKYHDNMASRYIVDRSVDKYAARNPFFATGAAWKSQRAETFSALTFNKLSLAYPIWKESALKLRHFVRQQLDADRCSVTLDTEDLAKRFTVHAMSTFLWGIDASAFENEARSNVILKMADKMLEQAVLAIDHYFAFHAVPWLRSVFKTRVFPAETNKFFLQLTKDAMKLRLKDGNANRTDLLNHILQLRQRQNISSNIATAQTLSMLLDGYETAAVVIYHTLFYLARYPAVQEKLRAEIMENLDSADGFLSYECLNSLVYLEQCVLETMRLISPVATFSRICTESTELEVEHDKRIPIKKGTVLIIPTFSFHHDADYFPKPYEFNPERFDNGAHLELTKNGVLMAFGAGPRICLGMRLGLLQVKTCVVEIIRAYRVKCCAHTVAEKKPDSPKFILGLIGDFRLEYESLSK